MAGREYIIPYSRDARKRHYHKTMKGRVVEFMVQLEVQYKGAWKEVVRYDCAHGFAHRDSYDLSENHTKEELRMSFQEVLTLADEDLDDNWEEYKEKYLEGSMP